MFPTTRFRIVYDGLLKRKTQRNAAKEYLAILYLAAKEDESLVDDVIRNCLQEKIEIIDSQIVNARYKTLKEGTKPEKVDIHIKDVNLDLYDLLLPEREALCTMMN